VGAQLCCGGCCAAAARRQLMPQRLHSEMCGAACGMWCADMRRAGGRCMAQTAAGRSTSATQWASASRCRTAVLQERRQTPACRQQGSWCCWGQRRAGAAPSTAPWHTRWCRTWVRAAGGPRTPVLLSLLAHVRVSL
jgi:hypothetical protein